MTDDIGHLVEGRFEDVLPLDRDLPALRVEPESLAEVADWLARHAGYDFFYDLTAVDERERQRRPDHDFTLAVHVSNLDAREDLRLEVPLEGEAPSAPTLTEVFPAANWYEREAWDMFGITFDGHPDLRRILMPSHWEGHPLRKDHPARATEMGPLDLDEDDWRREQEQQQFDAAAFGLDPEAEGELTVLNVGPQHPGTHGVLRIVLLLDGERIVDAQPDIGFHHRGAEKMAERQSWHTFIPYTDRIDYLGGVLNNLPYVLAVEKLAGIEVPDRARLIRIMLCELFRIASHLVWYGTFAQDVGMMSPVFYMFSDREHLFRIIESICGARMHPNWFRIGGVAQDLPEGWREVVGAFLERMPARLDEYDQMVMGNHIFKARTQGIGRYDQAEAIRWGVTGPGLRATGKEFDWRKAKPYGGYDQLDFEIPTAEAGDSYARGVVRIEEMRQSLRIITQCVELMPDGSYKARHPQTTPPPKDATLTDIETLIDHFLNVSWGPVIPEGEAFVAVEGAKGSNAYWAISDGGTQPYRLRIRTPSFPHLQMLPAITRGLLIPDLLTVLGSIDYVLADVDR